MADRYTKIVLTVIAAALVMLVFQNEPQRLSAQAYQTCGNSQKNACYVRSDEEDPLIVKVR